jgi:hypothetical protein
MTRHSFISPGVFGPEAIAGMSEAYEAALATQPNAVPEVIAGRVIAAASAAVRRYGHAAGGVTFQDGVEQKARARGEGGAGQSGLPVMCSS